MARRNNSAPKQKMTKSKTKALRQGPTQRSAEQEIGSKSMQMNKYKNDVAWYATTPSLLIDAASIPFSQSVGTKYTFDHKDRYVPGIMTFKMIPIIGDSQSPNSPVNIASTALYSFVRHANSGSANYDSPDLMQYVMAVAQVYSYINFLQRIYGTMTLYSHSNRYLPRALVYASGVDFDDVQASLANFRYAINVLIHKAASLACPADLTYFRRLAFLFSGIYSEGESVKSQLYMNVPVGFLQYAESTEGAPTLSLSRLRPFGSTDLLTTKELLDYGAKLLNPLLSSESINIMSGDILKAYGQNILKLTPLGDIYTVIPVTDLTVLEQMQNMDILPDGLINTYGVTQNNSSVSAGPFVSSTVRIAMNDNLARMYENHLLTTILTQPGPGDVIERTRGMVTLGEETGATGAKLRNVYSGSDICVGCTVWRHYTSNTGTVELGSTDIQQIYYMVNKSGFGSLSDTEKADDYQYLMNLITMHCGLENFKFHPKVFYANGTNNTSATATDWSYQDMAVDIDNYALISRTDLDRMNEAALLALFNVPSIARF